ncbi:hypothetical protein C1645_819259 [Glomus cerebriforme]|uniref:Uncharacterized protein n=1 Tax=Glomus cerebriforme TaxID=658196 RepID=A0A397T594_9GLOM|nr:hypothetical protein C1645_819259 [Glomus cerebriforme]
MEGQKQINFRPISKNENFLPSSNINEMKKFDINDELEDKLCELNSVSFSKARKRRESAAIFNRLSEDTSINLLNDSLELSQTFEEEGAFEFHSPNEFTTPEMEGINYIPKVMGITCSNRDSTASLRIPQNDMNDMNASQKYLSISSENTRKVVKSAYPSSNGEFQQATNNTLINETKQNNATLQKRPSQDLVLNDNTDESLLIEQRARTTLSQFKEMMSKFKVLNVDAQQPPSKSVSKSELKANLSHIKCPDDVVRFVNHSLYSPIGIHRTYPAQEMKLREQHQFDVNNNGTPLKKHTTKEFTQSRLFPRYERQEFLTPKDEMTKAINQVDFQQSMPLEVISKESIINKGKILRYENKFSLGSPKSGNNSNKKGAILQTPYKSTSMVIEPPTENLDERNELRKRKRTFVTKPLSPHLSSISDSNIIQAKSDISPAVKKMKIQPSNLRAPTSISRLKYNANQRKVGVAGVSLNSSKIDNFRTSTNSQMRFSRQTSNTKQRK